MCRAIQTPAIQVVCWKPEVRALGCSDKLHSFSTAPPGALILTSRVLTTIRHPLFESNMFMDVCDWKFSDTARCAEFVHHFTNMSLNSTVNTYDRTCLRTYGSRTLLTHFRGESTLTKVQECWEPRLGVSRLDLGATEVSEQTSTAFS